MRNTFSILFYINRSKLRNGKAPVMGRITINGTKSYFSCKCTIEPSLWSTADNRAIGKSPQATELNFNLDNLRARIVLAYNRLLPEFGDLITARMVKNNFTGMGNDYTTLLQYMKEDIDSFSKRVNKDRSSNTLHKMRIVHNWTRQYIYKRYRSSDIYLQELEPDFIKGFSQWLQFEHGLKQSTVWVYTTYLKKIVINAHLSGKIKQNPFHTFRINPNVKQREFLSSLELKFLIGHKSPDAKLNYTKNLFLFSCFTGISFADLKNLKLCNIHIINGKTWIISRRQKSNIPFQIQLMKIPERILMQFIGKKKNPDRKVFEQLSYATVTRNLKNIARQCNINKNITFHLARHTFATMALSNGMPIESISSILGHSNISTTQIYAKVINYKLSKDFEHLELKLQKIMDIEII